MIDKCKICGNNRTLNYFKDEERIKKCQKCGVGFLSSDLFTHKPDYYEEGINYSTILEDRQRLTYISENAQDQLCLISKFLKPKDKALLDVGAHTGQFVREASKLGFVAEGIELNKNAVKWAQDRGISVQQVEPKEFNPKNKYDVITVFHVLEHFSDPIASLLKIKDLLSNEGYLAIEVPNSESYLAKLDDISWKFIALEHLFYFTEDSLKNTLRDLGFSTIYSRKRNYEINYLNLRKLMRYLTGEKIFRDRFKEKNEGQGKIQQFSERGLINTVIQKLIVKFIRLLGREDHIFIIARKND